MAINVIKATSVNREFSNIILDVFEFLPLRKKQFHSNTTVTIEKIKLNQKLVSILLQNYCSIDKY